MTPLEFHDWRKGLGLTQEQLAELLNVSRRSVIDWESGETAIPDAVKHEMSRRGTHGPVTLFWHTSPVRPPGSSYTAQLQAEEFRTVNEALDRGCQSVGNGEAFTAHITDEKTHEMLWDLPALRRE